MPNGVVGEPFHPGPLAQPGYQTLVFGMRNTVLMAEDELTPFRLGMPGQGVDQPIGERQPVLFIKAILPFTSPETNLTVDQINTIPFQ